MPRLSNKRLTFAHLIKLNYAILYLSNFEKQEISLTIYVVDKGIIVVLELNDKKNTTVLASA